MDREGMLDGGRPVTFLRVFKPMEAQQKGIDVTGRETFDQHPDLILFEGYLTQANEAYLERKRGEGPQAIRTETDKRRPREGVRL